MTALDAICARYNVTGPFGPSPIELRGGRRDQLPGLFRDLGYKVGAEVGVWKGEFSEELCKGVPGLRLYCIDPWVVYAEYKDFENPDHMAASYKEAKERLAPYDCTFIRDFSPQAAIHVPDRSLDFVYIDGNHSFESVIWDISAWSKKVKVGGIVAGHDYKVYRLFQGFRVVEAVQAYAGAYDIAPWFVLGRSKALRGEGRERERSWLWVNPAPQEWHR